MTDELKDTYKKELDTFRQILTLSNGLMDKIGESLTSKPSIGNNENDNAYKPTIRLNYNDKVYQLFVKGKDDAVLKVYGDSIDYEIPFHLT